MLKLMVGRKCKLCGKELVRKAWRGSSRIRYENCERFNVRMFCDNISRSKALSETNTGKGNYFYGKHFRPWNTKRAEIYEFEGGNGYIQTRVWAEDGERIVKYKHRYVMELHIGRELLPEEVVHHIDENPKNNDISNLMLFPNNAEHKKHHAALRHTRVS